MMSVRTCSVCAGILAEPPRRCSSCNSIVCSACLPAQKPDRCVNCEIEDGQRWFTPAAEEPLAKLPRRLPLPLLALVVLGPVLIVLVAKLMGSISTPKPAVRPVHFEGPRR
jgi:hypothetical protein